MAAHVAAGDTVNVAWFTDGVSSRNESGDRLSTMAKTRRAEASAAMEALGVNGRIFEFAFPDQRMDMVPAMDIATAIWGALVEVGNPSVVYTHCPGDLNQDHRRVAEATLIACRGWRDQAPTSLVAYEVPETTHQSPGMGSAFRADMFHRIPKQFMDAKLRALECYSSETRQEPHPRSSFGVRARAAFLGSCVGAKYAEAFQILRAVRDVQ